MWVSEPVLEFSSQIDLNNRVNLETNPRLIKLDHFGLFFLFQYTLQYVISSGTTHEFPFLSPHF